MPNRKLFACYDPWFFLAALGVAAILITTASLGRGLERGSAPRLILGAVQAVAMGGFIVWTVMVLRRLDEMHQRIHYESLAYAFAATGALITGCSFLEHAGLPGVEWGVWAWPVMIAAWGISLLFVRRRYL